MGPFLFKLSTTSSISATDPFILSTVRDVFVLNEASITSLEEQGGGGGDTISVECQRFTILQ